MSQPRQFLSSFMVLFALSGSALSGQYAGASFPGEPGLQSRTLIVGPLTVQEAERHTHKLTGFGAGVTVGAIVMTLDDVLGSSCIGSGAYLTICRFGFVAAASIGGGLGTLVGALTKTESPPGRTTRVMVGSAIGVGSAFLVSAASCHQEDSSNPEYLCGYDGMLSAGAAVTGAAVGGLLGVLLGKSSESLELSHFGVAPERGGGISLLAGFTFRPH